MKLNKIEVKKTKVIVTKEIALDSYVNKVDAYKKAIISSIITGASGNCIRQVSRAGISEEEYEAIKVSQDKFRDLMYELEQLFKIHLDNIVSDTHKFH